MRFSTFSGTAIVPTLARLVLAAAFITAGYSKAFVNSEYTEAQKTALEAHGVYATNIPPADADAADLDARAVGSPSARFASLVQEADNNEDKPVDTLEEGPSGLAPPPTDDSPVQDETDEPAEDQTPDAAAVPPAAAEEDAAKVIDQQEPTPAIDEPAVADDDSMEEMIDSAAMDPVEPGARYEELAVHHLTLMIADHGWQYPKQLAWCAALTELVGGLLILIGLFSRFWGLALAGVMVVAFYMTSLMQLPVESGLLGLPLAPGDVYSTMYLQLGLFVLAFGVFLTGPGPLSLDRVIFGRREPRHRVRLIDEDSP